MRPVTLTLGYKASNEQFGPVELLEFFATTYSQSQGFAAPPVHDPCAVAYVIDLLAGLPPPGAAP